MVGLGRRKTLQETPLTKTAKRIATLQTHELTGWVESCLYQTGRSLSEFNHDPARIEALDEALGAAEVCVEILREYRRRVEA